MQHLDSKSVKYFFLVYLLRLSYGFLILGFFIIAPLMTALSSDNSLSTNNIVFSFVLILILFLILYFLSTWIWAKLTYKNYKYQLREDGFRKENGIIWKRYVTIPYDRIQNVDIYRGVISRFLGLSDLNIQTAGSSVATGRYSSFMGPGAEGRLPALSKDTAEKLRDELVRRAKLSRSNSGGL